MLILELSGSNHNYLLQLVYSFGNAPDSLSELFFGSGIGDPVTIVGAESGAGDHRYMSTVE